MTRDRGLTASWARREHYVKKGGSWKAKMSFEDEASADNWVTIHSSPGFGRSMSVQCVISSI